MSSYNFAANAGKDYIGRGFDSRRLRNCEAVAQRVEQSVLRHCVHFTLVAASLSIKRGECRRDYISKIMSRHLLSPRLDIKLFASEFRRNSECCFEQSFHQFFAIDQSRLRGAFQYAEQTSDLKSAAGSDNSRVRVIKDYERCTSDFCQTNCSHFASMKADIEEFLRRFDVDDLQPHGWR